MALVKSWLSMGRCERCSSAAEHGKGDTRDAGGGRGISTGRAGGTRRSRGDLPRRAPGSRLFEDSVVATRRSGRLGSAGREALNAPACGLAARSGARAAEIGLVSVRRTEEREARAGVEPRGARERLGEVQLSGLWRGGLAARGAAVSLASTSACWRARSRSRSRRGCWRRGTNFVLVDHSLAASRALGYPSLARGEDRI